MKENCSHLQGAVLQRRNGFTLIELLVVIAIIALLAAILFPVFARARENARKSSCANNLKQIGVGITQYIQDFDEMLPPRTFNNYHGISGETSWRFLIFPYVKSAQLYTCPSNPNGRNDVSSAYDAQPAPKFKVSYAANRNVLNNSSSSVALADIQYPAQLILIAESVEGNSEVVINRSQASILARTNGPFGGHLGAANFVFVDGHVKALRPLLTVPGTTFVNTASNFWVNTLPDAFYGSTGSTVQSSYITQMGHVESAYK